MHEPGDHREERSARHLEAEGPSHLVRIGALSAPIVRREWGCERRVRARVPALVDTVQDAGQASFVSPLLK